MASSYFFNGRLFSTPTVMSQVNDTEEAPSSATVGNALCLIGASAGGQPLTALKFSNPSDAAALLVSGPLCDAAVKSFNPSNDTNAAGALICVRVGQATQAALTLNDGTASPVIDLVSQQYGLGANQTRVKVAAGSVSGKALTAQVGNNYYTQDNTQRAAFTVQYSGGQATASMTITNTTVTLFAPNGSAVATIDLTAFPLVQDLVNRINTTTGFAATPIIGSETTPALQGLDSVSAVDVKTALYTTRADLQACIDWFNSAGEGYVTATRHTGAGAPPANIGFTYLVGGTSPGPITGDWTNALAYLQTQDVQWITPLIGDPSIHAAVDAHCQFMSSAGRKERRAICGPPAGTTLSAAQALPANINSDRTSLAFPGYYDFNAAGKLTLYDPFMMAALVAAGFAGLNPGEAMTNKSLTIRGLELALKDPVDTDAAIQSGLLVVMQEPEGYKVVRSISTWLANNNFNRVEQSTGSATDYALRTIRNALGSLKGQKVSPQTLGRAVVLTEGACILLSQPSPEGIGVLVGDANSPPYQNITAKAAGDTIQVRLQMSPAIPANFIPVTASIVPYTGSVTLTVAGA